MAITAQPTLGGHLKTGHTWTLQNRPTERNQNKSIYTLRKGDRANIFEIGLTSLYWLYLGGGYGNAGMRPERRLSGRNGSGRRQPLRKPGSHSGANALNPRGLGTESPSGKALSLIASQVALFKVLGICSPLAEKFPDPIHTRGSSRFGRPQK